MTIKDMKEYQRNWYLKNKEEHSKASKTWSANNKEKHAKQKASWVAKNKEKHAKTTKQWSIDNPERFAYLQKQHSLRQFGITVEEYDFLVGLQNSLCTICDKPETQLNKKGTPRDLSVDHCHKTGRIRGLLCASCNLGIGHFKDDIELLKRAINYLENDFDITINFRR